MAEFTTASEFPNEYKEFPKCNIPRLNSMEDIRSKVAFELIELRKSYYMRHDREFASISKRIIGYFFLDLISYSAYRRASDMMFNRGLTCV